MPRNPRSDVSFAKTTLPYPIFAAEFDPYNRGYLIVGGGGGESKSGVPNQISVLDVSNRAAITTATEIDLSREEDSVQSLGSLATKDGLVVLAGINSSAKDQSAGKNEHLRSFEVKYPPRKKAKTDSDTKDTKGAWKLLSKCSLFRAPNAPMNEAYQRILRLSPARPRESGSKRVAAIATGMAKQSQVMVFDATSTTPGQDDILTSIDLPERAEANDLDIAEPEDATFSVAYCTDYNIYEQTLKYDFKTKTTEKTPRGPRRVVHPPDTSEAQQFPKFRCLRFLNSQNLVALANLPDKKGAELRVYHLYPTGPAMLMQSKKLPGHIKQASSMDVCGLDADADGNQQLAIAIAGQDISIEIYTTNYQGKTNTFSPFTSFMTLRDVHEHQMTKICFSPFHPPPRPAGSPVPHQTPQYIRLASVSYGNTVIVDTFPVVPLDSADNTSRYVLNHPTAERWMKAAYVLIISLVVLVTAFLIQSFRGDFSDSTSTFSFLPDKVRSFLDEPVAAAYGGKRVSVISSASSVVSEAVPSAVGRLQDRLSRHNILPHDPSEDVDADAADSDSAVEKKKALVIRSAPERMGGVTVDVHPDKDSYREGDTEAKHWHELDESAKGRWKERLQQAGEWAEAEGEKVLFGVLFSEYAGLVGEGVGQILREL